METPRKSYPRFTRFGFHVNIPDDLQTTSNSNLFSLLDASLSRTQDFWCASIKNVYFIPCGKTTAVLICSVSGKQPYLGTWIRTAKTMFSDWSKTLGEEAVCEPSAEESKRITAMFTDFDMKHNPGVHQFWRKTNHSIEIRQPSPIAGMVANALSKADAGSSLGDWRGVGSTLRAAQQFKNQPLKNLPMLPPSDSLQNPFQTPLPTFASSLGLYSQILTSNDQLAVPRKKQAEETAPDQPPAKRTLTYPPTQPSKPVENPFKLKSNHLEELKNFLLSDKPWNAPVKYREMKESEVPVVYRHDKKVFENKLPAIAVALTHLIPPIARRSACQGHLLTVELPHTDTLTKIYNLLHCNGWTWNGIYSLLQWPNMHFQTYGFSTKKPHYPSLSPIEAHRRILRIEADIAQMTDYIAAAITAGRKNLRSIAWMDQADAVIVLSATKPEAVDIILEILPQQYKNACILSEQLDWLEANRAKSLTHHTPFLTELGWGLGLLALLYSLKASTCKLDDPEEAEIVLTSLMAFTDRRAYVFAKDMEPILLYGARLTKYATKVRDLCEKFNGLGQVPLTTAGKFYELDVKGRLVGADGNIIQLGIEAVPPTASTTPRILPFPIECASLKPDYNLETICADLIASEGQLISAMLADLDIDPQACPILALTTAGQANINSLFATDSHTLNQTSVLPPSASLPEAWFEPGVVFGV